MTKKNTNILLAVVSLVIITSLFTLAASYAFRFLFVPQIQLGEDVSAMEVRKFNYIRRILKDNFYKEVDDDSLIEGAIAGMANALEDPYTVYFTKAEMDDFTDKSKGSYTGIGIYISVDPKDNLVTVVSPIEGTPAQKAGLLPGDKIVKVDDKDVSDEKDEDKIISMIKGIEGTKVKITVYRASSNQFVDFDIIREKIKIQNIKSEVLENDIGYIKLLLFDENTANDFEKSLNELLKKNIKGLIIDVRDNPGGIYQQVVDVCDRILPEGVIVYTEDRNGRKEYENSDANQLNIHIAVLVNEYSASASEILAGALKDHKKAVIIGKKTFGKGLVQNIFPIGDGSGLKVTVSRYFTPSGVCIQNIGIQPDIEVDLPESEEKKPVSQVTKENDTQLKKAIEVIKTKILEKN